MSPLLQLPAEVRNMIFGYVIGGQLIHIYGYKRSEVTTRCCALISENEAQEHFYATDPELFEQPDKTHGWSGRFSRDSSRHYDCQEKFSLSILRVCRQIYHEVKDVLYFANTFSFRNPTALQNFTSQLLKSSANPLFTIRSLHLDIQLCDLDDHLAWNNAIRNIPIYLPNVRSLYINLDMDIDDLDHLMVDYDVLMCLPVRYIWELYQLRVLPLKEVVVIVADEDWAIAESGQEWFSTLEDECRWTMGQKQGYATEIREVLLRRKKLKLHPKCRK